MKDFSAIYNADSAYIDLMYKRFLESPDSVEEGWKTFFKGFEFGGAGRTASTSGNTPADTLEYAVIAIIHGFRTRGHLLSTTNPILTRRDRKAHLDLADYGLSDADLSRRFEAGFEIGLPGATLQQIIDKLKTIYCGNIGFEYSYIENRERRHWLRSKIEELSQKEGYGLQMDQKKRILEKLNGAVVFESFLNKKYVGQKRFSLEGGESAIPALDATIQKGAEMGVEEVIIGMAHRGRLNVLVNILGKTYAQIFNEFEGETIPDLSFGDGDVKYHLGFESQVATSSGKKVDLKLVPNPSHLESVDPIVEGFSRAKADLLYERDYDKILPILIHGDAAIAGQGVVYETVQMSKLDGYYTGGTIHFVINNQVGFTTDFDDARSATYCTSVAAMVQAPVFHVNGDDPEAVVFAITLATEYRQKFNNDVFIDMVCYRRHGHNEGDDPKFTQPEMYDAIKRHPDPREIYVNQLLKRNEIEKNLAENMQSSFWEILQERLDQVKEKPLPYELQAPEKAWTDLKSKTTAEDFHESPETGIDLIEMKRMLNHINEIPDGYNVLSKFNRIIKKNKSNIENDTLDWAQGELCAYGSLLLAGKDIRMSGQDVKRGTFSHRHAVLQDTKTDAEYNRLSGLSEDQGRFSIYNSLLSEFAVLGFEYGYSLASPEVLVLWEAQFGDFYNGAQTIVDQYITAAESKWQRNSGLVMLLPHGYAGQGPEHSSARLERFLQQGAEFNITIANITSPANLFHAFRRQLVRDFRKPLIIMSPKSLLRHPQCVSSINDFGKGTRFQEFIAPKLSAKEVKATKKVIFCTGKFYYDLHAANKRTDIAICRVEQLYPFPKKQVDAFLKKFSHAELIWAQEEPSNMGAADFIRKNLMDYSIEIVARKSSASPATGFKKVHEAQQAELIEKALK